MIKPQYLLLVALMLATAGMSHAATPDQVGTWVGKFKNQTRFTTGTVTAKSTMQLQIAADDSTIVTIDGTVQLPSTSAYQGEGFLVYIDPTSLPTFRQTIAVIHFNGTKIKGATAGFSANGGTIVDVSLGKFSLKKQ